MTFAEDLRDYLAPKYPSLGLNSIDMATVKIESRYEEGYAYSEYTQADGYTDLELSWDGVGDYLPAGRRHVSIQNDEIADFLNWVWAKQTSPDIRQGDPDAD